MKFDNVSRGMTAKRPAKKWAPGSEFFCFFFLDLLYVLIFSFSLSFSWSLTLMTGRVTTQNIACSRLRDSRVRGIEKARTRKKKREETRSSAYIFACLSLMRHPTVWKPGTGYAKQFLICEDFVENRRFYGKRMTATKSAGTHRDRRSIIIINTVVTLNDDLWMGLL